VGHYLAGSPHQIAKKLTRHSDSLGGVSRITFNMDMGLSHEKMMESIELLGNEVLLLVNKRKAFLHPFI
jgi:hypothetical protein